MESELVNLPKLQSVSVLAVLRPQVTAASCVFVLMSVILAWLFPVTVRVVCTFCCFQVNPVVQCLIMSPTMRSRSNLEHMAMMKALIQKRSCWMAATQNLHPLPAELTKLWKHVSNTYFHSDRHSWPIPHAPAEISASPPFKQMNWLVLLPPQEGLTNPTLSHRIFDQCHTLLQTMWPILHALAEGFTNPTHSCRKFPRPILSQRQVCPTCSCRSFD